MPRAKQCYLYACGKREPAVLLRRAADAMGSISRSEWFPYEKDRTMGLNHQMASLSCALGEAFHTGRTYVATYHDATYNLIDTSPGR